MGWTTIEDHYQRGRRSLHPEINRLRARVAELEEELEQRESILTSVIADVGRLCARVAELEEAMDKAAALTREARALLDD